MKADKVVNKTGMSDREMLISKLALFAYNNTGYKKKYAIYEPFVPSDKSRRFAIKSERFELGKDTEILAEYEKSENMHIESPIKSIKLGDKEFSNLFNIIEAEASRINYIAQLTPEQRATFSNKYLKGGSKFLILPRLNDAKFIKGHTDRYGMIDIEGLREDKHSKLYLESVLKEEVNNLYNDMRDAKVINERGVINYINKEYKESLKGDNVYRKNKGVDTYEKLSEVDDVTNQTLNFARAAQALTEMAYNDLIQGFNFYTLMGDPAHYYKEGATDHVSSRTTAATNFKRFGSMVGAKMVGNFKFPTNYGGEMRNVSHSKIKYLILKDRITDRYSEHYREKGINKDFGSSNSADAQVYTTLRGHIINLYALGKIDDNIFNSIHSKIIKNYKSGKPINLTEEEQIVLVPQKPLYTGEYMNGDIMIPFIEKSSTIPLTESMLKDTELDKLRLHMEELEKESMFDEAGNLKDFDTGVTIRAAHESAIKVGGVEGVQIYNEDGTINVSKFKEFRDLTVDSRNLGIQQEESLHTENKINIVSQMDKLLHSGTLDLEGFTFKGQKKTGAELRKIKDDIKTEWITKKFKELEKKYKIKDGRYSNSSKLVKHVLKVAEENGVGFADLDLMSLENGGFKYPLFANRSYKKVLAAMLSEISRGVLRPKISGLGSVQVSSAGMLFKWGTKNSNIIFTEDFNESLKYTRYEDGNLKSAQVLISREYFENKGVDVELLTKELEDGRRVIDTDKVDAELLKSIGAKLPNRNHSSMLRIEIAGFLPKEFKNIVIVPDEITKQMNSDFDIDHLYKYLYNYRVRRRTNSKPISAERKTQFDNEYEKFINERRWDSTSNKTRRLKNFNDFDADKAKMSVAKKLGLWYEVSEGKKNGNLYDIKKDVVLEKIKSSNTKNRTSAVLENEYIDIHHSVLEHPEVVKMSTRSLNFKDTEEIAKEMESLTANKEESKFFTILSNRFLRDEYEANQVGKDGISIQSSVSMLYSLIGKDKWAMKLSNKDKRFKLNIEGEDITFEHIGIGEYDYKGEARTNADNNTMMQNESVDNANNKRLKALGYSTVSAPAFNGFQFLVSQNGKSLPLRTISMIMNLPLVKDTFKEIKRDTDTFSNGVSGDSHRYLSRKVKSSEVDTKLFLDADTLEKALKGELTKEEMNKVENTALSMVATAHKIGSNIMRIYSSANLETKGIGISTAEIIKKEALIKRYVLDNKIFPAASNLYGKSVVMNGVRTNTFETALGQIYKMGIEGARKVFGAKLKGNPITPLGSIKYRELIEDILKEKPDIGERTLSSIENGFLNYVYLTADNPIYKEGKTIQDYRIELLTGRDSIFFRIADYVKDPKNIEGREFLETLTSLPIKSEHHPVRLITSMANLREIERERTINSFIDLLTSDNDSNRKLGIDILRLSLMHGNTYSPGTLNVAIPYTFLKNSKIADSIKEINMDRINFDRMKKQVIQHNPSLATSIRALREYEVVVDPINTEGTLLVIRNYCEVNKEKIEMITPPKFVRKKERRKGYPSKKVCLDTKKFPTI